MNTLGKEKGLKKGLETTDDYTPQHGDRWSRQEAYDYYVKRKEKTSIRDMVKLSGVGRSTLGSWSSFDTWKADRKAFHREIPDKWTIAECRDHYVRSPEPATLRQLVELSGVSLSTLGNYSSKDKWGQQRTEYQYQVRKESDVRHAETQSRKRAEKNRKIADNVFGGHRAFADVAAIWLQFRQTKLLKAIEAKDDKTIEFELNHLNVDEVNKWSNIYSRHAKAAIDVYGVLYTVNHDAAIALLDREGFAIREKAYLEKIERRVSQIGQELPESDPAENEIDSEPDNTSFVKEREEDVELEGKLPGTAY